MKQRLAIAATLLKDPALLVLDEPTNGLDPAGIREVRDTIRALGEAGTTVLLSSHILAEVQQVCTAATIIGHGKVLASGRVDQLLGAATSHRVRCTDPHAAIGVLRTAGLTVHPEGDVLSVETDDPGTLTRLLAARDIWVTELVPARQDLESYFLSLTAGDEETLR